MWLPVTLSLATGLRNPSVAPHIRLQACCLYAALTAVWLGTARGLGTPQSHGGQPATSNKTQGSRRLLENASRGVAVIFLSLTCQKVTSVTA